MNHTDKAPRVSPLMAGLTALALGLGVTQTAFSATQLSLPDVPLFLKNSVDPTILLTLDDSGSMAWAFMPDSVDNDVDWAWFPAKRYTSSFNNTIYYDPNISYQVPRKADGTAYTTSFTSAYEDGFNTSKGTVNLSNNYFPPYDFDPAGSPRETWHNTSDFPFSWGNGKRAYYHNYSATASGCGGSRTANACYSRVDVPSSQEQNFAIWYSFYRTRVLAIRSAASLAFQNIGNTVRLGFQNLHTCDGFNNSCQDLAGNWYDSRVKPLNTTTRNNFYAWLQKAPASGGTPLRSAMIRAGNLAKTTDVYSPYANDPGTTKDPMLGCRALYHIAMTDGIWNSDNPTVGNVDATSTTYPGGCTGATCPNYVAKYPGGTYTPRAPYTDSWSATMADIAFQQWITDAQPTIPNMVPTYIEESNNDKNVEFWNSKNDPAEWQHITTFMVAFGLGGFLTDPLFNGSTYGGDYPALANGSKQWPQPFADSPNNSYDLWHSAINGRGEFFSAANPNALVSAFTSIIAGINNRSSSAGSVSLDSGSLQGLSLALMARFNSDGWTGDVKAYAINPSTFAISSTPSWSAQTQLDAVADYTTRNITMKSGTALVPFNWTNLSAAQQSALNVNLSGVVDNLGQNRVNFIRGDRSQETTAGGMRIRKSRLGDILDSSPVIVDAPSSLFYDQLEGLNSTASNSYTTFKNNNALRRPMAYFASNDGMLHGVDATTGNETFAFIPTELIPNLKYLTYPGYSHKYYVDGPLVAADIYDNGSWKSILVGTLGRGGKTVFALDVTNPSSIRLLWEYTNTDLGNVLEKPAIIRLHNDRWGVAFGNGYNSANNKAMLFLLDAANGTVIKQIEAGTADSTIPNGLAAASPMDVNGDMVIDYIYSGDLRGNLWRFDLYDTLQGITGIAGSSAVPSRKNSTGSPVPWDVAYSRTPLFTAKDASGNRQPITSNVVMARHNSGTGVIIMFGTGRYLEQPDATPDTSKYQTYYGVWDRKVLGETTSSSDTTNNIRSKMQAQTMSASTTVTFTNGSTPVVQTVRSVSSTPVTWFDPSNPSNPQTFGWYLDLVEYSGGTPTLKGERVISDSTVLGDIVVFSSNISNADPCSSSIDSWLFGLDVQTGGAPLIPTVDYNGDNKIDSNDCPNNNCSTAPPPSRKVNTGISTPTVVGTRVFTNVNTTTPGNSGCDANSSQCATKPQQDNQQRGWVLLR